MDWRMILPHMEVQDIAFIQNFLQLNPSHRISSQDAEIHEYFLVAPLPCSPALLSHKETLKVKGAKDKPSKSAVIKSVADYVAQAAQMEGAPKQAPVNRHGGCTYLQRMEKEGHHAV